MKTCPVGRLGRHDMRRFGNTDTLRCCWCGYELSSPPRKRMPALTISKKLEDYENAASRPQTWR